MVEKVITSAQIHQPVMLKEIIDLLQPENKRLIVDATLGMGGHSLAILRQMPLDGKLVAFDRDVASLKKADEKLKEFEGRYRLIHDNYRNLKKQLLVLDVKNVDGIVMDFGISSFQLDDPSRGFSLRQEGPLDMRMDQAESKTAADLVNLLPEKELSRIIKEYGEDRHHNRIARYIVQARMNRPIRTTKELSDVVLRAMPFSHTREKIHPATRTFQALRIAVNKELESIELAIDQSINLLQPGGRIAVIAFHSLEDRIVKEKFRTAAKAGELRLLTKKPLRPTDQEVEINSRSRSARLRVAERT
jgi:16S rRNA (cytosine1402-N4)-methyltransferase